MALGALLAWAMVLGGAGGGRSLALSTTTGAAGSGSWPIPTGISPDSTPSGFDHAQHGGLFPRCASCHVGIEDTTRSVWPTVADCVTCHDGTVEDSVSWTPPGTSRPGNLRFTHVAHRDTLLAGAPDSALACEACHSEADSARMTVARSRVERCLECHEVADHYAARDEDCATCHLPLAAATAMTVERIADFPTPRSHERDDFGGAAHGRAAHPPGSAWPVAASCAVCHAQNFCLQCHVDAPEQPAIQALAVDARSTAITAELSAPRSHQAAEFYRLHGGAARTAAATCQVCHTRESCLQCHVTRPREVTAMHAAAPERGSGAVVERSRPISHGQDFSLIHATPAAASPAACATCHTRTQCVECHRADPGQAGGFHPTGFLERHPVSAYNQETQCADCHNTGQFCASCHLSSGVVAGGPLKRGFHDSQQGFILGHGQAARQNLESCVSCHAERDCLQCHSALGGRRFNPHGPDFDAERLRKKNPQMCVACHGLNVPGG